MKSNLKPRNMVLALALSVLAVLGAVVVNAETIKKLHSSPQLIINATTMNDVTEANSTTVDLSGADLDECNFVVYASSANGTGTLSYNVQVSADGGTSWSDSGDTIAVATGTVLASPIAGVQTTVDTGGATKLRLVPTITGSTTFYRLKTWATPSVD